VTVGKKEALPHLERRVVVRHAYGEQVLGLLLGSSGHGGTAVDPTWVVSAVGASFQRRSRKLSAPLASVGKDEPGGSFLAFSFGD
jgi:hypothetical protein